MMHAVRSKMSKLSTSPNGHSQDRLEAMGYERGEELGHGSFGYAIKVRRKQNGNTYVAKLQKCLQMDADDRECIIREITNMRQVAHPHIVRFRESFRTQHHICIIMDFCEGGDLKQKLAVQSDIGALFSERRVLLWLLQVWSHAPVSLPPAASAARLEIWTPPRACTVAARERRRLLAR